MGSQEPTAEARAAGTTQVPSVLRALPGKQLLRMLTPSLPTSPEGESRDAVTSGTRGARACCLGSRKSGYGVSPRSHPAETEEIFGAERYRGGTEVPGRVHGGRLPEDPSAASCPLPLPVRRSCPVQPASAFSLYDKS